jgi:hypothetical protein
MYNIYLTLNYLVLRAMIQYLPMILLPSLSSLITLPRQLFCMHEMHDTTYDNLIVTSLSLTDLS